MDVALPYSLLSFSSAHRIVFFLLVERVYIHVLMFVEGERERERERENALCCYHKTHTALSNVHINLGAAWSYMRLTCLSTEKP